ncbi:MAG: DUF1611 domain-containing protein [Sphingomonadales bacterium]
MERDLKAPYLLFLGDGQAGEMAKTAEGIAYWRPELVIGECAMPGAEISVGAPKFSPAEAAQKGARSLVIGVAPNGGQISPNWLPLLKEALDCGLDIISGLHARLSDIAALEDRAAQAGRTLHDVRHPIAPIPVGTGAKRPGKRLLTVGSDCAVGKMFTSFALEKEMRARGLKAAVCTTGQTGIMISGKGIAIDAVVSDFVSGAVEQLAPATAADMWQIIEGQGSLFHPSFAGVTLGLVHGAQPDCMVLCHSATRAHMFGLPDYRVPSLTACIAAYEAAAQLTNSAARVVAISLNTKGLSADEAKARTRVYQQETSLPCVDPIRDGAGELVDAAI